MQIHKKMTALLLCLAAVSHADFKLAENGQAAVTLETGKNAPEQLAERESCWILSGKLPARL